MTILSEIVAFLNQDPTGIASSVIASASYDFLKNTLNFKSLKTKIGKLFRSEKETEIFIQNLCERPASNNVESDIKALYQETTGSQAPLDIQSLLVDWLKENKHAIENINNIQISHSSGFNIGVQNAARDIINIQGDYRATKDSDADQ
ncbi:hypothetical protein [Sphingobacterium multivorum]|uniref:Uncharacterized protein n=1 Tax=Sphingobacterium multivorum TaxID=28454 RepID=A0A2X2J3R0_SPHMU|nr:hypothetical protein [Sphingobacterium multivorum]QRQ61110.1 hypothetical protein I6J33_23925 [Sphingobacterium multivorum]SPZ88284.1 Uncharacterised protein [Sphingobacterium multivorum]